MNFAEFMGYEGELLLTYNNAFNLARSAIYDQDAREELNLIGQVYRRINNKYFSNMQEFFEKDLKSRHLDHLINQNRSKLSSLQYLLKLNEE